MRERIDFNPDYGAKASQSIIKVIGVGGGGGNAVKHMYKEGIIGVDFLICNTDRNALEASPIPSKLVLGESGLGAGAKPEVARQLALDSRQQIVDFIGTETKMLFITAGLGKGTGTGAAPVVAEIAREMDILTIAVVTLPFKFEGTRSAQLAESGLEELRKHVDSLIVIKNQNIIKHYNDEEADKAFGYADDVLKNAVKCIAELITVNLEQNIDFNDVNSIMRQSGTAMLGIGEASGENRIDEVLDRALQCPLLTEEHISDARNFLFSISYGSEKKLRISELEKLTDKFEDLKNKNSHVIWGRNEDPALGDKIKLSVIISNYSTDTKEVVDIVENSEVYEGEKQPDAQLVSKESTVFADYSLENMKSALKNEPENLRKEDNGFGFLNNPEPEVTRITVVTEPVLVTAPPVSIFDGAGPQQIRSTYDPKYEDDNEFSFLVGTPAIERLRQENKEDYQDKAIQNNQSSSFILEDDIHEFFKNRPD
ncbi:MAG: cell division protein FtsZ [Bacteroidetes bacterium]|nr:cell division protein FtsZ [Bacteroidota bacterium]MCL2302720.1 cell division protein FtsZ [Lentimicrobiaceae bacterium]